MGDSKNLNMKSAVLDNSRVSTHLGKTSEYKDQYDPSLLVREPRSSNRLHLDLDDNKLPFKGYDMWNAYEVSGLTVTGLPVAGVAKIVYPCESKYIVESKSIKLYFNSFNMYKCGDTRDEVLSFISNKAAEDLSSLLETDVNVYIKKSSAFDSVSPVFDHDRYMTLEDMFTDDLLKEMNISQYTEDPSLLHVVGGDIPLDVLKSIPACESYFHSSLLKSNCRVTSQPDWGDIYIYIKSQLPVAAADLLRYIISFRDECHFHEEICETVYKRLLDTYIPEELCVTCLYARRGGIDINPTRASSSDLISKVLIDPTITHCKTPKQ
jgi:7-cyano-7-deazaguanine reductase